MMDRRKEVGKIKKYYFKIFKKILIKTSSFKINFANLIKIIQN